MAKDDTSLLRFGDLATAIALLTRVPVRARFERGARAAWAYPFAGVVVAGLAALPTWAALSVGLTPMLAALVWLAATVVLTGAMHEDGLADCADGFWGGWETARRLEIMKDSQIGSYGVIALCLSLAGRWGAVSLILAQTGWFPALLATSVLSRATMPALMAALPHARDFGLSHAQGRPGTATAVIAAALAALTALALTGPFALILIGLAGLSALCATLIARSKIGGQTGDVLGATQQISEIALLCALTL